ncbi:exported hypothetical protein [Streptomyces misionensis JCM 4497]
MRVLRTMPSRSPTAASSRSPQKSAAVSLSKGPTSQAPIRHSCIAISVRDILMGATDNGVAVAPPEPARGHVWWRWADRPRGAVGCLPDTRVVPLTPKDGVPIVVPVAAVPGQRRHDRRV